MDLHELTTAAGDRVKHFDRFKICIVLLFRAFTSHCIHLHRLKQPKKKEWEKQPKMKLYCTSVNQHTGNLSLNLCDWCWDG